VIASRSTGDAQHEMESIVFAYCRMTCGTIVACKSWLEYRYTSYYTYIVPKVPIALIFCIIRPRCKHRETGRYSGRSLTRFGRPSIATAIVQNKSRVYMGYYHSHPACTQQEAGNSNGSLKIGQTGTSVVCARMLAGKLRSVQHIRKRLLIIRGPPLHARSSIGSRGSLVLLHHHHPQD